MRYFSSNFLCFRVWKYFPYLVHSLWIINTYLCLPIYLFFLEFPSFFLEFSSPWLFWSVDMRCNYFRFLLVFIYFIDFSHYIHVNLIYFSNVWLNGRNLKLFLWLAIKFQLVPFSFSYSLNRKRTFQLLWHSYR